MVDINNSEKYQDIVEKLNLAQREAVETLEGPLLIIAGPGSGKTRVITHRIAYLIRNCGIRPYRIIAVTFTNKAAREMAERLHQLLGWSAEELTLGTFHAICARILRREGKETGLDPRFVIYDEEDQLNAIKRSLEESNVDSKRYPPGVFQSAIKAAKSQLLLPEQCLKHHRSYFDEMVGRVYEHYEQILAQSKALDFDDLIMKTVLLFQNYPQVLSRYQERYFQVLVDEFQDTNIAQYMLARQLAGKYRNLCVVGDPDQSIYSWRFADLRNILQFEKDYPDAKVVLLEQNYRSSQTILAAAQRVISVNRQRKEKKLWTTNEDGFPVAVVETDNEQEEARFVVNEVEQLLKRGEIAPKDCAVMYRTNAQSRALEEAFIRYGLPYKLVGGIRFYQRREVKDVIAYLRLVQNPEDDVSLSRIINVPGRGIGQHTVGEMSRWAKLLGVSWYQALQRLKAHQAGDSTTSPLSSRPTQALLRFLTLLDELRSEREDRDVVDLLDLVLEQTNYKNYLLEQPQGEERWENILELRQVAKVYGGLPSGEGLASFLEGVTLVSDVDGLDERADSVVLTTLHQAKGLEFPVVFIVGMEEGLFPHIKSFDDPGQIEEERRLCYVGMTRAKKRLYLVYSYHRSVMGGTNSALPSRFLRDIPSNLLIRRQGREEVQMIAAKGHTAYASLMDLQEGDRVYHNTFGDGTVISCTPVSNDQELVVDFGKKGGARRLLLSLAPLWRIE